MTATVQPNAFTAAATGKVVQVLGNVVDVEFTARDAAEHQRRAASARRRTTGNSAATSTQRRRASNSAARRCKSRDLVLEVQGELGNNQVRCLAMGSTDGLVRGATVINSGGPIKVPVGEGTLGRIFNVLGRSDRLATRRCRRRRTGRSTGRRPDFAAQDPTPKIFETGHQGHRPDGALHARRQGRTLRRRRRRQDRADPRADPQHRHRCTRASRCSPASASARAKATTCGSR